MEAVLSSFVKRLGYGVKPDLLPLMAIRGVQPSRARCLWNAGFRTPSSLIAADPADLVKRVKDANKDAKSALFFSMRSAVGLIREAQRAVEGSISDKRWELVQLTQSTTQSSGRSQPTGQHAHMHNGTFHRASVLSPNTKRRRSTA